MQSFSTAVGLAHCISSYITAAADYSVLEQYIAHRTSHIAADPTPHLWASLASLLDARPDQHNPASYPNKINQAIAVYIPTYPTLPPWCQLTHLPGLFPHLFSSFARSSPSSEIYTYLPPRHGRRDLSGDRLCLTLSWTCPELASGPIRPRSYTCCHIEQPHKEVTVSKSQPSTRTRPTCVDLPFVTKHQTSDPDSSHHA